MTSDPQTYPKIYGERGDSNTIRLTDDEREALRLLIKTAEWQSDLPSMDDRFLAASVARSLLDRSK